MNRIFTALSAAAALAAAANAQCFESNFGTSLGVGDDTLFAAQPMNISFPMGGAFAAYDHVRVNTNGCAFLWSGATGELDTTATGYSTSATTMVTNLRGAAGGAPRIAPYWCDLNMTAANNAGVWLNNSMPGRCVITWENAVHYNTTSPVFTVQAQLFDTGVVQFFYSGAAQNVAVAPACGISQGGLIADPGVTDLSAGAVAVPTARIVYQTFATTNTFDLPSTNVTFAPNAGGGYNVIPSPCVPAANTNYGSGCADRFASLYQHFANATLASPALTGQSVVFTPVAGGYLTAWGGGTYLAPTVAAVNVFAAPTDDGEAVLTPTAAFPTASGPQATVRVHSNGVISWGAAAQTFPGGNNYTPDAAVFLNAGNEGFWAWHDYNETESGSGRIVYEEVAVGAHTVLAVTWNAVENYSTPVAGNPSTMQMQLNLSTGACTIVGVNIDSNPTSAYGSAHLLGYSPAGASIDPGNFNLATTLPVVTQSLDGAVLTLEVLGTPLLGATVTWTTSNIPAAAVTSAQLISLGQFVPGQPLPGAPGCMQSVDLGLAATVTLMNSPIATYSLTVPNNAAFVGVSLFSQSASLVSGANALGVITSNALRSVINTF